MMNRIAIYIFLSCAVSFGSDGSIFYSTSGGSARSYPLPTDNQDSHGAFVRANNAAIARETERALQNALAGAAAKDIALPNSVRSMPDMAMQVRWIEEATSKLIDPRFREIRSTIAKAPLNAMKEHNPFQLVEALDDYQKSVARLEETDHALSKKAEDFGKGLFIDNQGLILGLPDAKRSIELLSPVSSKSGQRVRASANRLMLSKQILEGESRLQCQERPETCDGVKEKMQEFRTTYDQMSLLIALIDRLSLREGFTPNEALETLHNAVDYYYGVAKGIYGGASDIVTALAHPITLIESIVAGVPHAIVNYPETLKSFKDVIGQNYNTMLYGTYEERGQIVGRVAFELFSSVIPITKVTGGVFKTLGTMSMAEKGVTVAEKISWLAETGKYAVVNGAAKRIATIVSIGERAKELTTLLGDNLGQAITKVGAVFPETMAGLIETPRDLGWLVKAEETLAKSNNAALHTAGMADAHVADLFKDQGKNASQFLIEQGPEALAGVARLESTGNRGLLTDWMKGGGSTELATLGREAPRILDSGSRNVTNLRPIVNFLRENNIPLRSRRTVIRAFGQNSRVVTISENKEVYRYWKNGFSEPRGEWVTSKLVANPARDLALPTQGPFEIQKWTIPEGTEVIEGLVAPNLGKTGGANQIFVPNPGVLK